MKWQTRAIAAWIAAAGVIAPTGSAEASHTLRESLDLLMHGHLQTQLLIVKKFDEGDSSVRTRTGMGVSGPRISPLFKSLSNGREGIRLRGYETHRFDHALSRSEAEQVLRAVYSFPQVEFAYFEPLNTEPVWRSNPTPAPLSSPTPDFESLQFHLKPAPLGVDAEFAWELPGGTGTDVRVIDVERGWYSDHSDFAPTFWDNGVNMKVDHGTAVWGEIAAKRDGHGVTGIAYGVDFGTAGVQWDGSIQNYLAASPEVYEAAADRLRPGDVLVIEQHAPGPDNGNFCPSEYWEANFDAIRAIVARGIIVVAAGGNGNSNLDAPAYQGAFDRNVRDSGAILVGAGAPPGGANHLQRMEFSNYGTRIDAFGYGDGVVTTGYGDLRSTPDGRGNYTRTFSGTSSATPIVAGAIAALQGILRAQQRALTPLEVRDALHETGTLQRGNLAEPIGRLPDLHALRDRFCADGRLGCN